MAWMLFCLRLALLASPVKVKFEPCEATLPMPTACPCPAKNDSPPPAPVASRPVKFLVITKRMTPAAYDVAVTPCKGDAKPWTNIVLPANGQALVATRAQMAGCGFSAQSRRLHVRHCGTVGCMAQIELRIIEPRTDGGRCVYSTEAKLPLGVEKTLALAGDTPEPMCVKVRVQRKPMPASAALACTGSITLPPARAAVPARPIAYPMPCMPPLPAMPYGPPMWPNTVWTLPNGPVCCPMPPPMPLLPPMMSHPVTYPVSSVAPCTYVPALAGPKMFHLVKESGKSKIAMHTGRFSSKAVRMTLEEGLAGTLRIAAGTKRVHLSGTEWKAEADKVELATNGTVTLHGHCKLTCEKLGAGATLAGHKLTFHVQAGRFVELAK